MTDPRSHVAVRALAKSVLINMAAPGVVYAVASRHFGAGSLGPLAASGLPPLLWLAYGLIRLHAIDWLGFFAAENVVVRIGALLLAHTERGVLIGRSSENVFLALLFLGSVQAARPLMFYLMRQLATGNDPAKRKGFDAATSTHAQLAPYRVLTLWWSMALVVKAAGSFTLAMTATTSQFLVFSPLWDLAADVMLVGASIVYGRARIPDAFAKPPMAGSEPPR